MPEHKELLNTPPMRLTYIQKNFLEMNAFLRKSYYIKWGINTEYA